MKIGVLALQGAFAEHIDILKKLGVPATDIRQPAELFKIDGLIIPGGESTSITKIMHDYGIAQPLQKLAENGLPIWGTCAGMICLARHISGNTMKTLGVMNINVKRNAFGRQVDSFETDLHINVLGPEAYHAVFIRAPIIESVGESVEILAKLNDGTPVAARQNQILVTSFHPELTGDYRFHKYFIEFLK